MFYFLDRIVLRNPIVGDIVKIHSPSLKEFYRAKIISIENKEFRVFYIDFGITETIHLSNIFELSEELKEKVLSYKFYYFVYLYLNNFNYI